VTAALLYESVARIARHEAAARSIAAVGRVTNVHPADGPAIDHAVTVTLRESGLTLPKVPVAVGVPGFAAIPAVGDVVVILFAEGDLHAPVVVGSLYHADAEPPAHKEGQIVLRLPASDPEPSLNCEISGDPPSIRITLPDAVEVELTKGKVHCRADQCELVLDARGQIDLQVGDAAVTMKKDGTVRMSCKDFKVQASGDIELKASGTAKVKGAAVELN
jgi:Type VI secretion system/phage-baseplate injector OB domain